jgi:hypothetical protein
MKKQRGKGRIGGGEGKSRKISGRRETMRGKKSSRKGIRREVRNESYCEHGNEQWGL